MKLKHKISLVVIGLLLVVSLFISTSYAIWMYSVSQESTNVVTTDCFEITFSDSHPIHLEYAFPMRDSDGVQITPYEFSVTNVCNHAADLQINLETLNSSTIDSSNIKADINGVISAIENAESVTPTLDNASSAAKIYEDTIEVGATKSYNARIWIKEDAVTSEVENKSYASKITVRATVRKKYDVATLKNGPDLNVQLKSLAGDSGPTLYTYNENVTSIERSLVAPIESDNAALISDAGSAKEIYVWFNDGVIYFYSDVDKIYMNENSSRAFFGFINLTSLDLSYFDTSKVTNMSNMFAYDGSLTSLDLSSFDTSNVTSMYYMFRRCWSLKSLNLSSFNTSKVNNMGYMFWEVSTLPDLDVSNFDTSNVTNMSGMFWQMSALKSLDVSHFNTSKVTNMGAMFQNLSTITKLDVSHFDTANVTSMGDMFNGCGSLTSLDLSSFNTSKVTNMKAMFKNMNNLKSIDVSNFDTSNVTDMSWMFSGLSNITRLDVSNFDTSKVSSMEQMFSNMSSLTNLNVSSFDISNVTNMSSMFYNVSSLKTLDVSNFNTSNTNNFSSMFSNMRSLTSIDVSNFDTSKAVNMASMFYGVKEITELDLSNFNTSNVVRMGSMFKDSVKLKTIYVGNGWDTSKLSTEDGTYDYQCGSRNMFEGLINIVGGSGTTYDANHVDKAYARVDNPTNGNPGYLTLKTN